MNYYYTSLERAFVNNPRAYFTGGRENTLLTARFNTVLGAIVVVGGCSQVGVMMHDHLVRPDNTFYKIYNCTLDIKIYNCTLDILRGLAVIAIGNASHLLGQESRAVVRRVDVELLRQEAVADPATFLTKLFTGVLGDYDSETLEMLRPEVAHIIPFPSTY